MEDMAYQAKQDQTMWQKIRKPFGIIVVIVVCIGVIVGVFVVVRLYGTGFLGKTLWDWLNLLGVLAVPIVVGLIAILFGAQQARMNAKDTEKAREQRRLDAEKVAMQNIEDTKRARQLNREAIQAQNFVKIVEYERTIDYSAKMKIIRELSDKQSYEDHEPDILEVVNFLNYVAHLIRHRYVIPQHVLLLYAPSLTACHKKLIETVLRDDKGWLGCQRNSSDPRYYYHFECLCDPDTIGKLWARRDKEVVWPRPYPQGTVLEELE